MLIKLGRFEFTECWDGVLYKNLPDYPQISEWEIQSVLDFIRYEEDNGRTCEIEADEAIMNAVETARREKRPRVPVPQLLTECTACPKYRGCMTDFVCHTSPVENAVKIFNCGSLLSPVKARGMTAAAYHRQAERQYQRKRLALCHIPCHSLFSFKKHQIPHFLRICIVTLFRAFYNR